MLSWTPIPRFDGVWLGRERSHSAPRVGLKIQPEKAIGLHCTAAPPWRRAPPERSPCRLKSSRWSSVSSLRCMVTKGKESDVATQFVRRLGGMDQKCGPLMVAGRTMIAVAKPYRTGVASTVGFTRASIIPALSIRGRTGIQATRSRHAVGTCAGRVVGRSLDKDICPTHPSLAPLSDSRSRLRAARRSTSHCASRP